MKLSWLRTCNMRFFYINRNKWIIARGSKMRKECLHLDVSKIITHFSLHFSTRCDSESPIQPGWNLIKHDKSLSIPIKYESFFFIRSKNIWEWSSDRSRESPKIHPPYLDSRMRELDGIDDECHDPHPREGSWTRQKEYMIDRVGRYRVDDRHWNIFII